MGLGAGSIPALQSVACRWSELHSSLNCMQYGTDQVLTLWFALVPNLVSREYGICLSLFRQGSK